ncbi:MAG: T9SS type A sorting domain-containing protein [Bacteroidia bacterium]
MKTQLLFIFLIVSTAAKAQYGTLDPTFGIGGKVITDIGGADDKGASIAIQSDGKLVIAGFGYNGSNNDVAVTRYQTDGSLDSTFGTNGKVTTAIGSYHDYGLSVAIQPDSKIVVGGYSHNGLNNDFALLRYMSNGNLDSTFGTNGIVTTAIGSYGDNANSIALQADGKIIAAGFSDTSTGDFFALARYNSNGSIDTTFGDAGRVITHIGLSDDQINSIKLQSDGKIIAGGYSYNGNDWDFALVRYNTNGSPDTSFGTNGIVTTDIGSDDNMLYSIALQSDGKIVGAGWAGLQFAGARYNTDGSLDNSFGSAGIVIAIIGVNDEADAVAIQTDGSIIFAGISHNGTNYDFGLIRLQTDGSADSTFGTGGKVVTDFGNDNDYCLSVAIQSDNKIVAVGFSGPNNGRDFALARYTAGPVGILEINATDAMLVYPNPVSDNFSIQFKNNLVNGQIKILNILGETVFENTITHQSEITIVVKNIPHGIYIVKVFDGEKTYCKKLIVEHY